MKNFQYYDRMMPMQDFLPEGKLGNLIALPLQGQALRKGSSAFVDERWALYKDQWAKLFGTKRLSEKELDDFIKAWCPDNDTMGMFQSDKVDEPEEESLLLFGKSPRPTPYNFKSSDAISPVQIILADGIYLTNGT